MAIPKTIKCPRCKQPVHYDQTNPYRPFCSERCQTLDLGAWADERFRIPQNPSHTDEHESDESPQIPPHKLQ